MMFRQTARMCGLALAVWTSAALAAQAQSETFTATATVKTAGGASATRRSRLSSTARCRRPKSIATWRSSTKAGRPRCAKPSPASPRPVRCDWRGGPPTPTRLTLERPTDKGRLLTIVTDEPVVFLGAGVPGAKPREGYDFAIIDLDLTRRQRQRHVRARGKGDGHARCVRRGRLQRRDPESDGCQPQMTVGTADMATAQPAVKRPMRGDGTLFVDALAGREQPVLQVRPWCG